MAALDLTPAAAAQACRSPGETSSPASARLLRSSAGIAFAVLLMMVQLGFERGLFRRLAVDGRARSTAICSSPAPTNTASAPAIRSPHERARRRSARSPGSPARRRSTPIGMDFFWTSPVDGKPYLVRVFAFDPNGPAGVVAARTSSSSKPCSRTRTPCWSTAARRSFLGMDGDADADRPQRPARPDRRHISRSAPIS